MACGDRGVAVLWPADVDAEQSPHGENVKATASAVRFSLRAPEGTTFPSSFDVPFACRLMAGSGLRGRRRPDGTRDLWVRALDSDEHRVLAGTDGANSPFWSPDSEWVGFFAGGSLKKVPRDEPDCTSGCHSSRDDRRRGLEPPRRDRVPWPRRPAPCRVSGGTVSRVGNDAKYHLWPQFLDDGEHYLYASFTPRRLLLGSLSGAPPRTLMTFPVNVSGLGCTCPDSSCSCRTASCWPGHSTRIGSSSPAMRGSSSTVFPSRGPDARRSLHPGLAFWRFRPTRWEPRRCCGGSRGMVTSPAAIVAPANKFWVLLVPG